MIDLDEYIPLDRKDLSIEYTWGDLFTSWTYKGTPVVFTYSDN